MTYPTVLSEDDTIERALSGASLSRFGDGELRLALGKSCASQSPVPALADELKQILAGKTRALPCIPNIAGSPRAQWWEHYAEPKYRNLMKRDTYGSAFVTRPDNMPSIDRPAYWAKVRKLWAGRNVILVAGDAKSLTPERMPEAQSVTIVEAPKRDAYAHLDGIQASVDKELVRFGAEGAPVIMCLGAAATVLAHRLAAEKKWALDLGHVGMFMKSEGAFSIPAEDLASKAHRVAMAEKKSLATGWQHAGRVITFAQEVKAESILDYGCGSGTLRASLVPIRVYEYDVGVEGKSSLPKPCNLVTCVNVLQWVELTKLDNVLTHIGRLASKGIYIVISASGKEDAWKQKIQRAFPTAAFEVTTDELVARIKK